MLHIYLMFFAHICTFTYFLKCKHKSVLTFKSQQSQTNVFTFFFTKVAKAGLGLMTTGGRVGGGSLSPATDRQRASAPRLPWLRGCEQLLWLQSPLTSHRVVTSARRRLLRPPTAPQSSPRPALLVMCHFLWSHNLIRLTSKTTGGGSRPSPFCSWTDNGQ